MLRRTTASPRPASGAGVRSMRARPATSATRSRRPAAKWPNASSAGASNTARCARPNIEASQPSLPTSCSILSPTISCGFPSSSPPEAESARKPENRFRQTEIQQQRTETAWLPQVFQQTARAQSIRGRMATGGLFVPQHAEFLPVLKTELLSFPAGQHDDIVDALGLIGQILDRMSPGHPLE